MDSLIYLNVAVLACDVQWSHPIRVEFVQKMLGVRGAADVSFGIGLEDLLYAFDVRVGSAFAETAELLSTVNRVKCCFEGLRDISFSVWLGFWMGIGW